MCMEELKKSISTIVVLHSSPYGHYFTHPQKTSWKTQILNELLKSKKLISTLNILSGRVLYRILFPRH